MTRNRLSALCLLILLAPSPGAATQEPEGLPSIPFQPTPDVADLDAPQPVPAKETASLASPMAAGPITPAGGQPAGALSGRIVFTSGGHGWTWTGSAWALGRPLLNSMVEDYGNIDQMTMFVFYCFNAGATVVPMRPVGFQTNEVVLDNVDPAVTWSGAWSNSTFTNYYGAPGAVPYRFASLSATETATATYTPNIPVAGFYPVYTWVVSSGNRTNQLYRINHTGGQSLVRVPHHMVGNGWVYLGTYYFNAGSNSTHGAVIISNLAEGTPGTSAVIADAIRFGNGMGDVNRGGGVSGYPREEEAARYWIQRSLGQGQPSSIYDSPSLSDGSDNVGAPIRMAVEMNREAAGNMFKRVYVGFHSNAGGGRGVTALYNDPSLSTNVAPNSDTPNQYRYAQILGTEVNTDLVALGSPPLEVAWHNRGNNITYANPEFAYGEINNNTVNNEFDATIVEVAFHDDASDALLMRDSKVRNWVARSVLHGVIRYLNEFDALPIRFLPEPPFNVRATATNGGVLVAWEMPLSQGGSGAATGYIVYRSTDGFGFGNPASVNGATTTALLVTNLTAGADYYFRVAATNSGGESFPSETVGCRLPASPLSTRILIVNGFTRFGRTLNLRQTPTAQEYKPPGHDANSGTMERVLPQRVNSFGYVAPHGKAITAVSQMGFDSCQVQAVTNGAVALTNYGIVIWHCGNQSTADRTFNSLAQAKVSAFQAGGGRLFVSGSEIAWDLDRASGPSSADRSFLHSQLHASLVNNTNDDSGIYTFSPVAGSIFDGNSTGAFDDGSQGIYWVGYPDAVTPTGAGAGAVLNYPGYAGGAAGIRYDGSAGGGKVVYLGFPFETIVSETVRQACMADILKDFSRLPRFELISPLPGGQVRMQVSGEPGLTYAIETSANLKHWAPLTQVPNTNGTFEITHQPASNCFYRALLSF
jgi:hypothetical protein